jgi:hypothetical protein
MPRSTYGRVPVVRVRSSLAIIRRPDIRVGDPDVAAEIILFTVEMNTHKFMAAPRTIPVETFENELVAMVTRYLRGDQ